jgi:hypothetical protein
MPGAVPQRYDFFLSRRGSVATIAQKVSDVLTAADYKVIVQDYDILLGANFIEAMQMDSKISPARPSIPPTGPMSRWISAANVWAWSARAPRGYRSYQCSRDRRAN